MTFNFDKAVQRIEIYDIHGKLVFEDNFAASQSIPLRAGQLPSGLYFSQAIGLNSESYFGKFTIR